MSSVYCAMRAYNVLLEFRDFAMRMHQITRSLRDWNQANVTQRMRRHCIIQQAVGERLRNLHLEVASCDLNLTESESDR